MPSPNPNHTPSVEKVCQSCQKKFRVYPYRSITAKFCSNICAGKPLKTKVDRVCRNCGSSFKINPSQFRYHKGAGRYCSQSCKYVGVVAEAANSPRPIKDKYGMRKLKADREWQKAVRERDASTCQRCNKVDPYIHAHHVAPRSRRPDLRHDVSNGKCLCRSCHSWVHSHPREATAAGLLSDASYELANKETAWRRGDNFRPMRFR